MITLRRRAADDTGASLLLALAFMTFLGLVVSSLLTYSGTSLRSTEATAAKAYSSYDVDGALQAAVNQVRSDASFTNAPADPPCPMLKFPGSNTKAEIQVTCAGGPGTGAVGGAVEINPSNRPDRAVLTLGGAAETGIDKGGSTLLLVRGDVFVNGTSRSIRQTGTACVATPWPPLPGPDCSGIGVEGGTLTARGKCAGTIVVPGGKVCRSPSSPAPDPAVSQPDQYALPSGAPHYQPVPPCSAARTLVFEPGYYDDAVALSGLTEGGCSGKTLLFRPGVYYFDFHNGDGEPLPNGPHVWNVNDANIDVVGGTPKGWTAAGGGPTIPGACISPLETAANGGVQFVFGGDSRLDVQAGNVELCGQYSTAAPPIAIYGAKSGADPDDIGPIVAKTDGTGSSTGPAFTPPENVTETGGGSADAVIDATGGDTTSELALTGFSAPSLPAGSILSKAELVVVHREQSARGSTPTDLHVDFTAKRAGATPNTREVTRRVDGPDDGPFNSDAIDVTDALSSEVHQHGLDGLHVTYSATVAAGESVTERLDSIQLELTWKPPSVRGQRADVDGGPNCVGKVGAGGCAMITASPSATRLYVQGTTYAPFARLDVGLAGVSAPVFGVGVIVRSLKINLRATAAYRAAPVISVPDVAPAGGPKPLEVYFRAYTCPSGASCVNAAPAVPWRLAGTARARFVDPDIAVPTPPYDTVTILSWAVRQL